MKAIRMGRFDFQVLKKQTDSCVCNICTKQVILPGHYYLKFRSNIYNPVCITYRNSYYTQNICKDCAKTTNLINQIKQTKNIMSDIIDKSCAQLMSETKIVEKSYKNKLARLI